METEFAAPHRQSSHGCLTFLHGRRTLSAMLLLCLVKFSQFTLDFGYPSESTTRFYRSSRREDDDIARF
jgi:hypothetical protein